MSNPDGERRRLFGGGEGPAEAIAKQDWKRGMVAPYCLRDVTRFTRVWIETGACHNSAT